MKKAKKILTLVLSALLLMSLSVVGTLAYLTASTKEVKNTFTVGSVTIDLDEAPVDVYGDVVDGNRTKENKYKLIPGHEYTKDPIVYVEKGSEQCYVFVKVVNGIENIEAADVADDTTTEADETKNVKILTQMTANGWIKLTGVEDADNVYYYKDVVDARNVKKQLPVFASFTLKDDADVASYADDEGKVEATITIDAYAVQADGFNSAAEAWTAAVPTWETATQTPEVQG